MLTRGILEREPSMSNEHLIKAGLAVRIDRTIRLRRLTQAEAAPLMGIDQPKVSAKLAGRFRGYSVERLIRVLVGLGHDVELICETSVATRGRTSSVPAVMAGRHHWLSRPAQWGFCRRFRPQPVFPDRRLSALTINYSSQPFVYG
jgi:predicted XRE-type DNA-binding protein